MNMDDLKRRADLAAESWHKKPERTQHPESERKKEMRALREQGLKHREIAERFGVSHQYVAMVCGTCDPRYYIHIGDECVYPNLRNWMNENKISRKELLRRIGVEPLANNYSRLNKYLRGEAQPRKPWIDKMLEVTGMTYEVMFWRAEDGK